MGRTIPSFRIASSLEEKEWKPFRNSLDKSDRKTFDEMFSIAHLYNSASSCAVKPIRIQFFPELAYLAVVVGDLSEHFGNRFLHNRLEFISCND
jgi:hypothetical protein